jgi:low temperature requirement protein LtrA
VILYAGAVIGRGAGWRVEPAHFAERHGLIVIIALGESFVAIGVGSRADRSPLLSSPQRS